MGLVSKLVKLGVMAGAAYAAVKVSDKYKEENPMGVEDKKDKINAVKQAATDVMNDFSQIASEKAPEVIKTVSETAEKAAEFAKKVAPDTVSKVQEAARTVAEKAQNFASSLGNEVYDAEFTDMTEEEKKADDETEQKE